MLHVAYTLTHALTHYTHTLTPHTHTHTHTHTRTHTHRSVFHCSRKRRGSREQTAGKSPV